LTYTADNLDLFKLTDPQREYRNLEDLYYREIDPVTELVQNSVVAIKLLQQQQDFRGQVNVSADGDRGELVVSDNGGGFESLEDIAANRSRRSIGGETPESGFGLGLTSVLARSDYFSAVSINAGGYRHSAEWGDVRRKLHGAGRVTTLPPDSVRGPDRTGEARKTVITVRGAGFDGLWRLSREEPQLLYEMMLAHSALGHTAWIWRPNQRPNIRFQVVVRGQNRSLTKRGRIGFPVVRPGGRSIIDLDHYIRSRPRAGTETLLLLSKEGRPSPLREHRYNLYVACEVERGRHFKSHFGEYLEDLKTNRILLSVNGFPQSFPIDRPAERRTRALWGNILAVVDASTNVVEPGRNRISDKFIQEIESELRNAVNRLDQAVEQIRTRAKADRPIDIEEAKAQVEAAVTARPLSFAVGQPIDLLKEPEEEAEVIALFALLLGRGLLDGTRLLRIGGSRSVYDAYIRYNYRLRDVGESKRPGRQEGGRRPDLNLLREKTMVTEFKLLAGGLASELLGGGTIKRLEQIDLLICWGEGSVPAGFLLDVLDPEDRFYRYATHRLVRRGVNGGTDCEVLVLSKFLEDLET